MERPAEGIRYSDLLPPPSPHSIPWHLGARLRAVLLLSLTGCVTSPDLPAPAVIEIVSGDNQIQGRGRSLHEPIVVRALDDLGAVMPGVTIEFSAGPRNGITEPRKAVTDSVGEAATMWLLGDIAGTHTLFASAPERGGPSIQITATARPGDFDIQIVADTAISSERLAAIRAGAERWTAVIVGDVPDEPFEQGFVPAHHCEGIEQLVIPPGGAVDDVLLGIRYEEEPEIAMRMGICALRNTAPRPLILYWSMSPEILDRAGENLEGWAAHRIGHLLGFGWQWGNQLRNWARRDGLGADTHLPDPLVIAAFDAAGGVDWSGSKVPVENAQEGEVDIHWRGSVMGDELMGPEGLAGGPFKAFNQLPLSEITVQSMATIGYEVDTSKADAYALPPPGATSATDTATPGGDPGTDVRLRTVEIRDETGRLVGVIQRW